MTVTNLYSYVILRIVWQKSNFFFLIYNVRPKDGGRGLMVTPLKCAAPPHPPLSSLLGCFLEHRTCYFFHTTNNNISIIFIVSCPSIYVTKLFFLFQLLYYFIIVIFYFFIIVKCYVMLSLSLIKLAYNRIRMEALNFKFLFMKFIIVNSFNFSWDIIF